MQIIHLPDERRQRSESINHIPCIHGDFDILNHTLKFFGKSVFFGKALLVHYTVELIVYWGDTH